MSLSVWKRYLFVLKRSWSLCLAVKPLFRIKTSSHKSIGRSAIFTSKRFFSLWYISLQISFSMLKQFTNILLVVTFLSSIWGLAALIIYFLSNRFWFKIWTSFTPGSLWRTHFKLQLHSRCSKKGPHAPFRDFSVLNTASQSVYLLIHIYTYSLTSPKICFVFSVLFDCLLELYWIHYSGFLSTVALNFYFKRKTNLLLCNQLSFIFSLSMPGTGIILVWPVLPQHLTWNELMLSMDLKLAI